MARSLAILVLIAASCFAQERTRPDVRDPLPPKPLTDISEWVQHKLNAPPYACDLREHPAGVYYLDKPIKSPNKSQWKLLGRGSQHWRWRPGNPMRHEGGGTRLVYRGPTDQVAITCTGERGTVSGFTIECHPDQRDPFPDPTLLDEKELLELIDEHGEDQVRAWRRWVDHGKGLVITKGHGLGSGLFTFEDLHFVGWRTGSQAGMTQAENNCDTSRWSNLTYTNCLAGHRQRNTQAMGHVFDRIKFAENVRHPYVIDGGGCQHVRDVLAFGHPLLTFTAHNDRKYRPGPNNRQFTVDLLKVDTKNRGRFRLMKTVGANSAHVVLGHTMISGTTKAAMGTMSGEMQLTVEGVLECRVPPAAVEVVGVK